MARNLTLCAALSALFACATTVQSGGITVYRDQWEATKRELAFHANAELGPCAARVFTLLERYKSQPVRVGVDGCGTPAVYERRRKGRVTHKNGASWELVARASPPELRTY